MANSNVAVHGNDGWNVAVNAPIKNMVFLCDEPYRDDDAS